MTELGMAVWRTHFLGRLSNRQAYIWLHKSYCTPELPGHAKKLMTGSCDLQSVAQAHMTSSVHSCSQVQASQGCSAWDECDVIDRNEVQPVPDVRRLAALVTNAWLLHHTRCASVCGWYGEYACRKTNW